MNFLDIENGVMTIRTTDHNQRTVWDRVTSVDEIRDFVERHPGELFSSSSLDFAHEYTTDPNVIALCDEVVNTPMDLHDVFPPSFAEGPDQD